MSKQAYDAALADAIGSGWCVSPNNIWDLPGVEVYPGCGGLACLRGLSTMVRIEEGRIDAPAAAKEGRMAQDDWPVAIYVYLYGGGPCRLARRYETWQSFVAYCLEIGTVSLPGLPAFMYGD